MSYRVTIQPSGNSFTVEEDETVLHAALDDGFHLPYGCRNGACGSCKGKILAGEVEYGTYQNSALSDEERAAGFALFCVARPRSDLVIECREIGAVKDIPVRKLPCRVQKIDRITDDVIVLHLALPANERLQFLPGQYIEFILRDGSRRSFSMANAPHDDATLELHIRHVPGGSFTDYVFNTMKEREILRFEGPLGSFFLREDSDKPVIFVASGTGFAPIKSILEAAFREGVQRDMVLYWGGRRPKDLYMAALAEQWAATHPNFRFVPIVSDALPEDNWQGRTGFVHRAVMEDHADLSGYQVYACGAPVMVEAARHDFHHERGLPLEEFYADAFLTAADLAKGQHIG
ncbi:MAG: CDP-6-deoxy-delta-3,4-glucoseen reductase [Pseudomonadota bacterium]|nr:MAG: CDP-6-deoxy-delta-3,4-glucoseen reductase [Pseudomonadota bacterium]